MTARCTQSRSRRWPVAVIALSVLAATLTAGAPVRSGHAQVSACVQPSSDGCPIMIGQSVAASLVDPNDVHVWRLTLTDFTDVQATLTNLPVDLDLHLYTSDLTLIIESTNEGLVDDVVAAPGLAPGDYLLYVNSPRGAASAQSYVLRLDLMPAAAGTATAQAQATAAAIASATREAAAASTATARAQIAAAQTATAAAVQATAQAIAAATATAQAQALATAQAAAASATAFALIPNVSVGATPNPVSMRGGDHETVRYQFTESAGIGGVITGRKWTWYTPANTLLSGPFTAGNNIRLQPRGTVTWGDDVLFPIDVGQSASNLRLDTIELRITFEGHADGGGPFQVSMVEAIAVRPKPGGQLVSAVPTGFCQYSITLDVVGMQPNALIYVSEEDLNTGFCSGGPMGKSTFGPTDSVGHLQFSFGSSVDGSHHYVVEDNSGNRAVIDAYY